MDVFVSQYDWIQRTRESLFRYCEAMSPSDYIKEIDGESIRDLHAHVADCYRVWLGSRALGHSFPAITPDFINNVSEMREAFRKIDALVREFLKEFEGKWHKTIQVSLREEGNVEISSLWLFTHTVTHEFHHKGQIVKLGRQMGYIPPDTDLVLS